MASQHGLFVVGGAGGSIATSPDGVTWTSRNYGVPYNVSAIFFAKSLGLFFAAGQSEHIRSSSDGVTWSESQPPGDNITINDGVHVDELDVLVFVGDDGYVWRSTDGGTSWARSRPETDHLTGVAWSPTLGRIVAIGWYGALCWSDDGGATWSTGTARSTSYIIRDVEWDPINDVFIASLSSDTAVLRSVDGITWTEGATGMQLSTNTMGLRPDTPHVIIAGGDAMFSTQGGGNYTWTEFTYGTTSSITAVAFSETIGRLILCVGDNAIRYSSLDWQGASGFSSVAHPDGITATAAGWGNLNEPPDTPTLTSPDGGETIDAEHTITWTGGADPNGDATVIDIELSTDNGGSWTRIVTGTANDGAFVYDFAGEPSTTTAKIRVRSRESATSEALVSAWGTGGAFTIQHNVAPNAPTGLSPSGGTTINRDATQRFSWTFEDPDAGDSQSKYDLRYRTVGSSTWTTVTATTTNTFRDVPAGTFTADDYEWQVRTYDAQGEVGPWSSSAYFAAASPPSGVTVTDPANGSTIGSDTGQVGWSAPEQNAFQVRKVADDGAGNPDTATVYYDSGEVVSASARNHGLTFPTNGRDEHLQVRVKVSGLWSGWASVRVTVSYTPPATPTLTVTPMQARGGNLLEWDNPTPATGEPAVTAMHVYRHDGDPDDEVRVAVVPPGGDYLDRTAAARQTYTYRVVAIGDNGTSTSSAGQDGTLTLSGVWLHPAGAPDDARQYRANDDGGARSRAVEQASRRYAGRTLPVVEYGVGRTVEVSALLHLTDHDALTFLEALQGQVVHYRDAAGRRMFATIVDLSDDATFYGWDVTLEVAAVDYDETVSP